MIAHPSWFMFALIGPILWAIVNYIDKYVVSKIGIEMGVKGIVTFSWLFSGVISIGILFFGFNILSIANFDKFLLILSGCFGSLAVFFYLKALIETETSIVIPLMQLVPVFSCIAGYIFFKEVFSNQQIFAVILIIFGTIILSINTDEKGNWSFRTRVVFLMIISAILFTAQQSIFKFIAINNDFWISNFWQFLGVFITGLTCLLIPSFRNSFKIIFRSNSKSLLVYNIIIECLTILGNISTSYALMLAPISLVMLVSSYQPVFVLIFGIILTIFFPKIIQERISKVHIVQKSLAIAFILVGSYFIYV